MGVNSLNAPVSEDSEDEYAEFVEDKESVLEEKVMESSLMESLEKILTGFSDLKQFICRCKIFNNSTYEELKNSLKVDSDMIHAMEKDIFDIAKTRGEI